MKKYAKIINEETKMCQVGIGTNSAFYESIGMFEIDVERAWDGNWYVAGYAPTKPQELINQERITELKQFLTDTDYVAAKLAEVDGEERMDLLAKYAEVLEKRKACRREIRELEQ